MEIKYLGSKKDVVEITLNKNDAPLIIKNQKSILGFKGESYKRKDIVDLAIKIKIKIIITKIYGESQVYIQSNGIGRIKTITLNHSNKGFFLK